MTKTKNGVNARQKHIGTFQIDYTSEVDDRRYLGAFTTKKLSIADMASLGVRKAQLNGGLHYDASRPGHGIDSQTDDFNSMLAHLEVSLVQTPDWWDFDSISDGELIGLVYEKVIEHENSFFRARRDASDRPKRDSAGENSSERDLQGSHSGGVSVDLVDSEVQSALEP